MKKLIVSGVFLAVCTLLASQVPQGFNFQAVARDGQGALISDQTLDVIVSLHEGSGNGPLLWEETHQAPTNEFGLMTLVVCGDNALRTGGSAQSVDEINWASGDMYIGLQVNDGGGWTDLGASQLKSVPYALVSASAVQNLKTLEIQPDEVLEEGEALFMVRREDGYPVFAVYENEVWVYTESEESVAGAKGGFAVGGYNSAKGPGRELMRVTADSTRIYIDEDPVKGKKGGFAIGGYNSAKANGYNELLRVTPDSTRVYVKSDPGKGVKGGFAVGGYNSAKTNEPAFMSLDRDNYFIGHKTGSEITTGRYNSVLGYESGVNLTEGNSNAFVGYQSGFLNTVGDGNLFLGYESGYSNITGDYNTFLGYEAGYSNFEGEGNTFLGSFSGRSNVNGNSNTFVGDSTGLSNTAGSDNTFVGTKAGMHNDRGYSNVLIGTRAGFDNQDGSLNVFLGHLSGYSNVHAGSNVFIGTETGLKSTDGWNNIYIGTKAGHENIDGEGNVFMGYLSGFNNLHGTRNVFLGNGAGYNETGSDRLYIENSFADSSSSLIWGNFITDRLRFNSHVGIGMHPEFNPLSLYSAFDVGAIALHGAGNAFDYSGIFFRGDTANRSDGFNITYSTSKGLFIGQTGEGFYAPRLMIDSLGNMGVKTFPGSEDLLVVDEGDISHLKIKGAGNPFDYSMLSLSTHGVEPEKSYNISHTKANDFIVVYFDGTNYIPRMHISSDGHVTLNDWGPGSQVLDVNGNARFRGVGSAASAFDLRITGDGTLTTNTSDARLKTNLQPIEDGLEKVLALEGLTFDWINEPESRRDAGLVAQEVAGVFPEAVFENPQDGYLGINYSRFPALFVEAFRDQQEIIDTQQQEIDELRQRLEKLEKVLATAD